MTTESPSGWITAADVARKAGVSRSAVSRTFTEGASVSPETREKVQRAAEALGYQVNMLARSMIQRQSNLVGVVVKGFDDPFLQSLLGPITHHLALRSLAPLLMDASEPAQLAKSLRHLLQYRIAGVILTSGTPPIQLAKEYLRLRVPVAMINRAPDLVGVDVVNSDHFEGGAMAARALLAKGARKLVFLSSATTTYSASVRGEGFVQTLAAAVQHGGVVLRRVEAAAATYAGGFDAAPALLADAQTRPDGVFCVNDVLACGLVDGARRHFGLHVPGDFQVVGFDDIPMAGLSAYALSTLRQDVNALAEAAVTCLAERMQEPDMPSRVLQLPVALVERSTLRP
ncbi:LacI family DNA-binding transcriptional regulator [Rhodoferax sp. WC2427]|uniref:LacI family DNA-binding transcriptional regulator n=1 Tax=Rhodoferax sp. WC2427 TaxID=3234144 RepID=UPI003467CE41